jgi:ABC-type phosphate transport system substrate-binding protein
MLHVMIRKRRVAYATAGLAAAAVLGAYGNAHAQTAPACSSFNGGSVVYFDGSTAVQPALQALSQTFAGLTPPIGIVYQSVGSCQGNIDLLTPSPQKGAAVYLDPTSGKAVACTLTDPINGQLPDIAVSDVFPATCIANIAGVPPIPASGYKEFLGPIQVMTFVTRKESLQSSISADAAYTVFGFSGQSPYQVMPWTDPTQMWVRKSTSGVINMISTAIGLAPTKWVGGDTGTNAAQHVTSGGVLAGVQNSQNADASIGILAADLADSYRNPAAPDGGTPPPAIKILAYKHKGQSCGWLPDSDSTHFDKINVRQGRYAIWGPLHFIVPVDGTGTPTNSKVATLLKYFAAVGPNPDATLTAADKKLMIDAEANAFTIPWCAMQVQRTADSQLPTPFQPTEPCGCYYESKKASIVSTCKVCTVDTDCSGSTPKCRYGFCEAK